MRVPKEKSSSYAHALNVLSLSSSLSSRKEKVYEIFLKEIKSDDTLSICADYMSYTNKVSYHKSKV
jgi:N-glycosylase/DNA lyase